MGVKHRSWVNILPVPGKRGKQNADIMKVNEESNKVAKEIGWPVVHSNHFYSTELGEPNLELFRDRINRSQPPNFGNRKSIEKDIHLSTVTREQGQFSGAQILAMKTGWGRGTKCRIIYVMRRRETMKWRTIKKRR